jgi:hypothetical protein
VVTDVAGCAGSEERDFEQRLVAIARQLLDEPDSWAVRSSDLSMC